MPEGSICYQPVPPFERHLPRRREGEEKNADEEQEQEQERSRKGEGKVGANLRSHSPKLGLRVYASGSRFKI